MLTTTHFVVAPGVGVEHPLAVMARLDAEQRYTRLHAALEPLPVVRAGGT